MTTILWSEFGGDRWKQLSEDKAEILMKELTNNPNVHTEDIIIFFENAFGSSSY